MTKVFVLIVLTYVNGGRNIEFQEFNSLKQCETAANIIEKDTMIKIAQCVEK